MLFPGRTKYDVSRSNRRRPFGVPHVPFALSDEEDVRAVVAMPMTPRARSEENAIDYDVAGSDVTHFMEYRIPPHLSRDCFCSADGLAALFTTVAYFHSRTSHIGAQWIGESRAIDRLSR
jgi:hypothetical protein